MSWAAAGWPEGSELGEGTPRDKFIMSDPRMVAFRAPFPAPPRWIR